MGLDQYIYKIRKAELEDRTYTSDELNELGLSFVSVENAMANTNLYTDLLPYTIKRNVSAQFINVEQIIADYNLPKDSYIGMMSYERIVVCGTDDKGEYVNQEVLRHQIDEKYTTTKELPYYIWEEEEIAYWRKNYDLQDWVYDVLGDVDNTKYCILNEEVIDEINRAFNECIFAEDPTDESALFYWEWY